MATVKRFYTNFELADRAAEAGYTLNINRRRVLTLHSIDNPDCWGTIEHPNTGEPVVGVRTFDMRVWGEVLPVNIKRIEKDYQEYLEKRQSRQ